MSRRTQGMLLLLIGGVLLKVVWSGTYVRYVKPGAVWLLVVAGVAVLALAVATLLPRQADSEPHDAHGHAGGNWAGWLLMVPALIVLAVSPPALGSFQASRNGTALPADGLADLGDLPPGDPVRISLVDYASRAVLDGGRSLQGRTVTLSGFVLPGPSGSPYLARLVVTCCAADARPIKIGLDGDLATGLPADTWIEVDGSYTDRFDVDEVNGQPIPYVYVIALRPIPPPEVRYES